MILTLIKLCNFEICSYDYECALNIQMTNTAETITITLKKKGYADLSKDLRPPQKARTPLHITCMRSQD
jgi:hypothetical protein